MRDFLAVKYLSLLIVIYISQFSSFSYAESHDLKDYLQMHIKEKFHWSIVEITELSYTEEMDAQPQRIFFEELPPNKTSGFLELKNGKKIKLSFYVKAYDWVVMSNKAKKKGDYLDMTDVYPVLLDVSKIPNGAINKVEDVVGRQLNRSISANYPITASLLYEQKVVKKGQLVFLVIESPYFIIRTTGELKNTTSVGDKAKVINLSSKKVITGKLVNENTVKVEF
ncbi:MAG: flagellar basal body P-ring formation chaperone FlgA [Thermodesulfovibrionales bacterium]|nr:flagellar basal body P-ring formation chaperone FlgA [Thermodesulfovibrionales bacterium]